MGFESGDSIKDYLIDAIEGGVAGGVGLVGYNKIGSTISQYLGSLGSYANVGAAYLYAVLLNYVSKYTGDYASGKLSEGLKVAGYTPLANEIYTLIGGLMSGSSSSASSSSQVSSQEAI